MEGVVVSAKKDGSTISVSVVTNAAGRFAFPVARLETGHYALKARAAGYELDGARAADVASGEAAGEGARWALPLALGVLAAAGVAAAFVSDWFVQGLTPAIEALHISQTFAGLVIVAIAGNAVENVVGIQLAARDRMDYALSVILNSPLQIALVLAPALVLLSFVIGGTAFTLVFPPLLVTTLVASVLAVSFIIVDAESVWLEGAALLGLYVIIAASFWWG